MLYISKLASYESTFLLHCSSFSYKLNHQLCILIYGSTNHCTINCLKLVSLLRLSATTPTGLNTVRRSASSRPKIFSLISVPTSSSPSGGWKKASSAPSNPTMRPRMAKLDYMTESMRSRRLTPSWRPCWLLVWIFYFLNQKIPP